MSELPSMRNGLRPLQAAKDDVSALQSQRVRDMLRGRRQAKTPDRPPHLPRTQLLQVIFGRWPTEVHARYCVFVERGSLVHVDGE